MLPVSNSVSPEPYEKPKTLEIIVRKNSFNSLNSVIQSRGWLLLTILTIQFILLMTLRSFPFPRRHAQFTSSSSPVLYLALRNNLSRAANGVSSAIPLQPDDECGSGRVFVYNLPKTFNTEILEQCDNLNPWSSRCNALANDGFGNEATGLKGIVSDNLVSSWYWTDQFVSEIIFHNRILNHKCRTMEAESATAFYIPFYAGLAVGKYLWHNYTHEDRDKHCQMMLRWVRDQPYWNRSNGWDHFITMGRITWDFRRSNARDWGSSCIYMPGMRNITRLLIERNPWDYFDVGVPYPTGFHPRSDSDVVQWQKFVRHRQRTKLFCFAGATRGKIKNDFRGLLLDHCRKESDYCQVVNCGGTRCSNGTSAIIETFLDSDFCMQPRGDSFTRRSIFDCMVAGSIPVFFWHRTAYLQYQWFLPSEPESYSVFIHRNEVKNGTSIREVLKKYSKDEVRKMREKVIEYIPKLVYARSENGLGHIKDAFDVAMDGVLRRFKEHEDENWYKWK